MPLPEKARPLNGPGALFRVVDNRGALPNVLVVELLGLVVSAVSLLVFVTTLSADRTAVRKSDHPGGDGSDGWRRWSPRRPRPRPDRGRGGPHGTRSIRRTPSRRSRRPTRV
jgi:hypothetical protein